MSGSKQLLQILTLRCEEASLLASQELDEPLGLAQRLAIWGHLLACRSCRRFRRQLWFLREALRRRDAALVQAGPEQDALSPAGRARIKQALEQASGQAGHGESGPDG